MNINEAKNLIETLISDVEAVGAQAVKEDWPDIAITYEWAKRIVGAVTPDEPRHGAFVVCYIYPDKVDADWESFDCEADAVERYEALVGWGYHSVSIAKPIRSTDYDCEPA